MPTPATPPLAPAATQPKDAPVQQISAAGQPWSAPWPADPVKNTTLSNLRVSYPRAQFPQLHAETAYALVRGSAGFLTTPIFGIDVEIDNVAYCRFWWPNYA